MAVLSPTRPISRVSSAGAFLAFCLLGAVQAMYGPAIPAFRSTFALSTSSAGLILSAHFCGAVGGIVLAGALGQREAGGWRVSGWLALVVLGCLAIGVAPGWAAVLAGVFVIGVGYGGAVLDINTIFASGYGDRSAAMLNLINAAFGVGAMAGPVAIGAISAGAVRMPFGAIGLIAAGCVPLLFTPAGTIARSREARANIRRTTPILLVPFILLFMLYVGLEGDIGGWEPTHLIARGFSHAAAANTTALFWAALTIGRILAAPISLRVAPLRILMVALGSFCGLMILASVSPLAPLAYTLAGLALAPVFPLGFVWLRAALPSMRLAPTFGLLGALGGGAIFPPLVGRAMASTTPDALPIALLLLALLCLGTIAVLTLLEGRRSGGAMPPSSNQSQEENL